MQNTYWNKMTQYRFEVIYLQNYLGRNVKIDRYIRIALAVTSASSIAAWAQWQKLAFWWGLIIVVSQVISAINDYLPYKKRIKEISDLLNELSIIYNDVERSWQKVANGSLTDDEINELCYNYSGQWIKADNKYFNDDFLPHNEKCKKCAEDMKNAYFNSIFGV